MKKAGFVPVRQKGSHVFLRHSDGRRTVVPLHDEVNKSTLMDILSQTRLEKKDLLRFLVETGHRRFKLKRRDFIIRAFSLSIAIGERLYTNEFQRCREMPSDK